MKIQVKAVTNKALMRAFLDLPGRIYGNDKNWVPPIRNGIIQQLAPNSDFKTYGDFQAFIALKGDDVVGRIVAATNFRLNKKENRNIGLFGYFECVDQQGVSDALFECAASWLKKYDCEVLRGPIDLSTHINCLFLIDGFDSPPCLMMPYNPPYYMDLVENAGFKKARDAFAYDFDMTALSPGFERAYRRALGAGIKFRPIRLSGGGFEQDCRSMYAVFNNSFTDNWSATPRSESEFLATARDLKSIADPDIFPIAEKGGEMIGFWMGLPDVNRALKYLNGRFTPWGVLKYLWHRRKVEQARVLAVGVLPEYQHSSYALGPALVHLGMQGGAGNKKRYRRAELSWVWEDNKPSRKLTEASGAKRYKTYRIL
ncbi:MAG: hypothetical protein GKR95_02030 [Gammaproteobacteria bacterium]|nr:hypothetical protein [Gammaproteobacteria bacterium]